jgi:hypothetical protein
LLTAAAKTHDDEKCTRIRFGTAVHTARATP